MATRKDVNYWAKDVKETREVYEGWKRSLSDLETEPVSGFIASLECHNATLEAHVVKLRRKLRRMRAAKVGVK